MKVNEHGIYRGESNVLRYKSDFMKRKTGITKSTFLYSLMAIYGFILPESKQVVIRIKQGKLFLSPGF